MQRNTIVFITAIALHVSGGFSTRHQELKNWDRGSLMYFFKYNQKDAT
jgi:hypothetical protein